MACLVSAFADECRLRQSAQNVPLHCKQTILPWHLLAHRSGCFSQAIGTQAQDKIEAFNFLRAGFTDSNAYLRELTLKSMLSLAPLLSQRTISQVLLKHLAKLQVHPCIPFVLGSDSDLPVGHPFDNFRSVRRPIRANMTILLGNLAIGILAFPTYSV